MIRICENLRPQTGFALMKDQTNVSLYLIGNGIHTHRRKIFNTNVEKLVTGFLPKALVMPDSVFLNSMFYAEHVTKIKLSKWNVFTTKCIFQ